MVGGEGCGGRGGVWLKNSKYQCQLKKTSTSQNNVVRSKNALKRVLSVNPTTDSVLFNSAAVQIALASSLLD